MLGSHNAVALNRSRPAWYQRLAGRRLCAVTAMVFALVAPACSDGTETAAVHADAATTTAPKSPQPTTPWSGEFAPTQSRPPPLEIFVGAVRTEVNAHSFCWTHRVGDSQRSLCADGVPNPARIVIAADRIPLRVQWLPAEVRVVIRQTTADSVVLYEGPLDEGGTLPLPPKTGAYDVDAHGRGDAGSASFFFRVHVS